MDMPIDIRLLIFEPASRGHPREWLVHLLRYAANQRLPVQITLAVPAELAARLKEWECRLPPGRLQFQALSERERRLCMHRNLSVSGMARWWTMRRHMRRARATRGLALGIDHLSLPLALGLGFSGAKVTGILFRPSTHYPHLFHEKQRLSECVRNLRKQMLYRLMLINPALAEVLSLDPYFLHHTGGVSSPKLRALPDPVPQPDLTPPDLTPAESGGDGLPPIPPVWCRK
jgi:hypothetical protein